MKYRGWNIEKNEWGYYEATHYDEEQQIASKSLLTIQQEIDERLI